MADSILKIADGGDCLNLVQITDTHLRSTTGGTLLGLDTDFSLGHVLDLVDRERPRVDLVLATGDISDHGSEEAYRRAHSYFQRFSSPVLWLAGNHDLAGGMDSVLGQDGQLHRAAESAHWQIVMLNSQVPGEVGGELGAGELRWLEDCLQRAASAGLHSLVCLHHQPVPMGSAWIDEQMVADSDAFFEIIDRFDCVRGILWGHVHQALDDRRDAVMLMSTPSTCIQFAPGSHDFKVDDQPPGYRWLNLHADGRIDTGVSRVQGVTFEVDLESSGYL